MGGTILLADDSITIQKVVELTFAGTDSDVVAVGSGGELLERLPEVNPDVVLCDVVMPDMNGYDVCQRIKSDPSSLHIPVVLLTGTFEPFDRERAIAAGCDSIVTKPFEARELVALVEELLQRNAAGGAVPEAEPMGFGEDAPPTEGLDFTTTGFDRMVPPPDAPLTPPDEGLEMTGAFGPGAVAATKTDADTQPVTPPVGAEEEEAADTEGPFAATAGAEERAGPPTGPFGAETVSADDEGAAEDGSATVAVSAAPVNPEPPAEVEAGETEEAPTEDEGVAEEEPVQMEAPATEDEVAAPGEHEEAPSVEPEEAVAAASAEGGPLSDDDVERIARRVVELAAPVLERIAWDVIPDMAEMLVRKRIRELEAAVEEEN